jgi:hypothetical protein
MRWPFRVVLLSLVLFMLKTPLQRLFQTTRHVIQTSTPATVRTMSSDARPTGLIATSGIELLTWGTPNGHKAAIILEELKAAYGKDYVYQGINIGQNVQKEPWFTKYSPNGRIPAIVDHDRNGFSVFEGAAILAYLTRHYDPEHQFSFTDPDYLSRCEQWIAWQHGGLVRMELPYVYRMLIHPGTNARTSKPFLPPGKRQAIELKYSPSHSKLTAFFFPRENSIPHAKICRGSRTSLRHLGHSADIPRLSRRSWERQILYRRHRQLLMGQRRILRWS